VNAAVLVIQPKFETSHQSLVFGLVLGKLRFLQRLPGKRGSGLFSFIQYDQTCLCRANSCASRQPARLAPVWVHPAPFTSGL